MDGNKSALWPIGITPAFEPKSRFEVLRWDYFTEDNLFSCVDGAPKCQLNGVDRDDVTDVIKVAVEELNKKYNPFVQLSAPRLVNGYRRLDHTRGMEYTFVTHCRPENTHREFQPSNRNEWLPKSPPFHAKVERVNWPHH